MRVSGIVLLDEKASAQTDPAYVSLISYKVKTKTHVKNISFGAVSGEESKTKFKMKLGSHFDIEGLIFTTGFSFSQDFNLDEFVLNRGEEITFEVASSDGTAISPQVFITLMEENGL